MRLVPESLNEMDFERGQDPKRSMGLGSRVQIEKDLEEAGIKPTAVDITDDLIIKNKSVYDSQWNELTRIQMKYLKTEWRIFVLKLRDDKITPEIAVDDALDAGIDPDIIKELIDEFGKYKDGQYGWINKKSQAFMHLTKQTRDEKKIKEDEENNIYAFVGWQGKIPVEINGKKYYEDGLETESIIKIDKWDKSSLNNIGGMKLRAQYAGNGASVYTITLPKDLIDEDRYEEIPDGLRDIFDKYKQRI